MVGAWCFIDHYGSDEIGAGPGMRVPPHPHLGLQTVSWLLEGEVLHRDSLGSRQTLLPGQLGLMTAGRGIMEIAGETREIRQGDLVHIPPNAVHSLRPVSDNASIHCFCFAVAEPGAGPVNYTEH